MTHDNVMTLLWHVVCAFKRVHEWHDLCNGYICVFLMHVTISLPDCFWTITHDHFCSGCVPLTKEQAKYAITNHESSVQSTFCYFVTRVTERCLHSSLKGYTAKVWCNSNSDLL